MRGSKIGQKRRDGSDFFILKREEDVSLRVKRQEDSLGNQLLKYLPESSQNSYEADIQTVGICLILSDHNFNVQLFNRNYCPGCRLVCKLLSSSCWLPSFGRVNDELQSTNNRGFKLLLGKSRCSVKLPGLANACHLDQMLPIKPDLRADSVLQ